MEQNPVSDHTPALLSLPRQLRCSAFGALTGFSPFLVSMGMSPDHRSPYLLAYPAVILSAWMWGLPGSIAAAVVAGVCIEHFIFGTHQINLAPTPSGWMFREATFVFGSIFVGVLTRSAAKYRQASATASLTQKLALADAERLATQERERATELALENEVRINLALDGANAGVFEWEVPSNKLRWSTGCFRVHGMLPGQEPTYRAWRSCVHPDDLKRVESELSRTVAEVGRLSTEYRVVLPDGSVRWIESQARCEAGPNGKTVRMSGYCGDVTRRKRADFALLQSEKLAVAGRLSAAIAHEVNNPLEAALNLVYLAGLNATDTESRDYLHEASQQLERVAQITHQTLLFSRNNTRNTNCRAAELLDATLRLLSPKLRMSEVQVTIDVREDPEFSFSPGELQQVFTNILNNAIDAIQGAGRIRIRISRSRDWRTRSRPGLRITLADTGTGMSAETLKRMREPFFTTKQDTGTGLGMWVVFELLEKRNGEILVSSSTRPRHHGTVISIFFPF